VGLITNSNPAVTAPVQISLFLLEEDGSTATNHVVFDNLSVHADEVLSPLSLHGSTGNSTLDWPDGGFPCVLEATPVLGPSASWAQVTNAPTLNGWYDTLTLTPTESTRFFRLHWQSY
jgi:hypothetical protein